MSESRGWGSTVMGWFIVRSDEAPAEGSDAEASGQHQPVCIGGARHCRSPA